MFKNIFLIMLVVFTSSCVASDVDNLKLSDSFFTPSSEAEKLHMVGTVKHIRVVDYGKSMCPKDGVCLHEPKWNIYEISGYFLPNGEDSENVLIAHKYGSALITQNPWLATLEEIKDGALKEKIGADYFLVGVELGLNVFCASAENSKLFKKWEPDLKEKDKKCFSI